MPIRTLLHPAPSQTHLANVAHSQDAVDGLVHAAAVDVPLVAEARRAARYRHLRDSLVQISCLGADSFKIPGQLSIAYTTRTTFCQH